MAARESATSKVLAPKASQLPAFHEPTAEALPDVSTCGAQDYRGDAAVTEEKPPKLLWLPDTGNDVGAIVPAAPL